MMKPMKPTKKPKPATREKVVHVRIDDATYRTLRDLAVREGRSISAQIWMMLAAAARKV